MAAFVFLTSCDEVESHRVLTFFFDGVPSLRRETVAQPSAAPKDGQSATGAPATTWSVHEPVKDCTQCHGNRQQKGFSPKVQLVAQVPQLCYQCHEEYARLEGWVHGPVATGACLLCHEPHKTKTESLLRKPVPDLCYQCHETQAVRAVGGHADPSYQHCTDCHEGHAGATRNLLRPSFLEKPAGLEYRSEIDRRRYDEALRKARNDLAQGQSFLALLRTTIDYMEAGQLWSARAYLEVLLGSNLVTDSDRSIVSNTLRQIVSLQTSKPSEHPPGTEGPVSLEDPWRASATALTALRQQRSEREQGIAELYCHSLRQYHAGRLLEAREGFRSLLASDSLPGPVKETVQTYLEKIEQTLAQSGDSGSRAVP